MATPVTVWARRWAPTLVLLLAAGGSGWLLKRLDLDTDTAAHGPRQTPDFYMENFKTTTMNEFGRPKRRLEAEYMAHFPDTDTNELTNPYLILYSPGQQPWHVRSEHGWVSPNAEVIRLLGEVHIWRDNEAGERELDLRTRDLRVLPEAEYGETDEPVVIRTLNTESRGVGMRYYMNQGRVELLSLVRTTYEKSHE